MSVILHYICNFTNTKYYEKPFEYLQVFSHNDYLIHLKGIFIRQSVIYED